nr:hypothetical protein L203_05090 [Cryptococcus depauperatus CBS 7841]
MRFLFRSPVSSPVSPLSPLSPCFPAKDASMGDGLRLREQDTMHRLLVEPYHSAVIHDHLAKVHASGRRSAVLDVGSGTGRWAAQLANAEPFADVAAVAPSWKMYAGDAVQHGNLDFSSADITRPLPWSSGYFDLIQVKGLARSVKSYRSLIERLARLLRRGGLLIMVESDVSFELANGCPVPACLRQWNAAVKAALTARGVDSQMGCKLGECVQSAGVFGASAYVQELGVPVACYANEASSSLVQAGRIHSHILSLEFQSFMPELLAYGYRQSDVQAMMDNCIQQLSHPGAKYLQKLYAVYAVKSG